MTYNEIKNVVIGRYKGLGMAQKIIEHFFPGQASSKSHLRYLDFYKKANSMLAWTRA